MVSTALPAELRPYLGRITDIDSHEFMPAQEFVKHFGPEVQPLVDYFVKFGETEAQNVNTLSIPNFPGDVSPVTDDIVNVKGPRAPGAVLPQRRLDVMDAMGVGRQLLFPSGVGLAGGGLYKSADNLEFMSDITGDRRGKVKRWFHLYNEWLKGVKDTSDRIRPAALLFGDTTDDLISLAKEHIRAGFHAVFYLPASDLPGGKSPAHPDLDPLWAMLAEANCVFTLHLEAEGTPLEVDGWRNAPAFEGFRAQGEFNTDPGYLALSHQAYENFLAIMTLGGVFERHPALRMGIIEVGSHWVGPLLGRLDMWSGISGKWARQENALTKRTYRLPHPPSYYIKKNVRVTPFVFEDVARQISTYDLGSVLCFSTDYPHVEGGKNAFVTFLDNIKGLGSNVLEDFFVNNGKLLFPA
jgi:predicted TIM-barrel fold metal-dependent hydrolase